MTPFGPRSLLFLAIIAILETKPALAEDLGAGKSAPKLFAADCSMCHSTQRSLPRRTDDASLVDFLQKHYTTNWKSAYELASYLLAVNSNARRGKQQPVASVSQRLTATSPLRPPESVPGR